MTKEQQIKNLADALMKLNHDQAVRCFSKNGTITSPLYGTNEAPKHFTLLFADLKSCNIKITEIFSSLSNPTHMIAIFDVSTAFKNGDQFKAQMINLFAFEEDSDAIRSIQLFYDLESAKKR